MSTAPAHSTNPKSSNSSSPTLESPPPALAEDEPPSPPPPSPKGSLPKESSSVSASSSSTSSSSPPSSSSSVSSGKSSISFPLSIKSDESSPSRASSMVPPKSSSPATTSSSSTALSLPSTSDTSRNSNGSGMNMPIIVGAAAGVGAFFVMLILAYICSSKKKRRKRHNPMQYYADSSTYKVSDSDFYIGAPTSNWHQEMDNAAKSSSVQPGGGGWHPLPPLMSGGEMSSGYSGPHGTALSPPSPGLALSFNKSTFTYEELVAATNGFSQSNLLGQGGFGYVHKGVLPNGKEVAVKQLKSGSVQGEREFHAEVDIISRVHHRHLVSLVGYCISGSQRVLVYEYVPNKTLEYHLHGKGLPVMNWSTRLKIALGSAKGLAYLHEDCHPRIIHRDIKCANILLDFKFEAMVADFGLAKLTNDNHTHVSTRVMGTFGYLAPEYASSGKLTEKSDVFSYGVMLLELITGRRPVDSSHAFMEDSLVDWARPVLSRALADGNFDEVADTRFDGNYDPMEMARMVACAAAAVRHSARRRPKMSQIVRALEGDVSLEDLNEGMRPGQSMLFSLGPEYETSSYTSSMNRIRNFAIASPEYSGTLSDYGHRRLPSDSDHIFSDEFVHQMHRPNAPL